MHSGKFALLGQALSKCHSGFTHCWVLTFKTDKDRDAYLVHPEHKAFAGLVGPVVDDVFVVDYWAKK